ncbi:hypothetical protein ABPG75_007453 [Micractinium tetrahymenae]
MLPAGTPGGYLPSAAATAGGARRQLLLLRPFESEAELLDGDHGKQRVEKILHQIEEELAVTARPWNMVAPDSLLRTLWDTLALLTIYMLLIAVPLNIAFYAQTGCGAGHPLEGLPEEAYLGASMSTRGLYVFMLYSSVFFAVDVALNFVTGVYDEAEQRVVYSLRHTSRRYLRTYFLTDVVACLPFNCVFVVANSSYNYFNLGDLLKLLRLVGIGRRQHGSPFQWIDRISEVRREFSYNLRRLVAFAFAVLEANHCYACLLWLVLRVQHFPAGTWPVQLNLLDAPVAEKWLFSFFSLVSAMIGLGYGSYPPITWPEALVWVFAMMTVATMFAVFNALIFSFILQNSSGRQEFKDRMDRLLDMLRQRDMPRALRDRVLDFMAAKYAGRRVDHDEEVLAELPAPIRAQVALLSCGHFLSQLPLFADHPVLLEEVAPLLHRTVAVPGQVLLQQGHVLHGTLFVRRGFVDISVGGASLSSTGSIHDGTGAEGAQYHVLGAPACLLETLGPDDCLAELALLPVPPLGKEVPQAVREELLAGHRWRATFTATALTSCELYVLQVEDFHRRAGHDVDTGLYLERAARAWARSASSSQPGSFSSGADDAGDGGGGAAAPPGMPPLPPTLRLGQVHRSMTLPTMERRAARQRSLQAIRVDMAAFNAGSSSPTREA